jgi:hypothetical protein
MATTCSDERDSAETVDWMNEATRRGDPWLTHVVVFLDGRIPFPNWIQERQRELTRLGLTAP